jgi:hypothetical protein
MLRIILTNGLISGVVVIAGILGTILIGGGHSSLWLGYLIMLVALSSILVGVKQYRDRDLGGVIGFGKALLMGLGIAVTASVAYVLVWEVYLAVTHYTFIDHYTASILATKRAAGISGAEYRKAVAEMATLRQQYADPLFRLPMTFVEIFPVGVLIALVTAVLVRNPRFLPASAPPGAA